MGVFQSVYLAYWAIIHLISNWSQELFWRARVFVNSKFKVRMQLLSSKNSHDLWWLGCFFSPSLRMSVVPPVCLKTLSSALLVVLISKHLERGMEVSVLIA